MTTSEELRNPKATIQERLAEALRTLGDRYPITGGSPVYQGPDLIQLGHETWWEHEQLAKALLDTPSLKPLLDVVDEAIKWADSDHKHPGFLLNAVDRFRDGAL